MIVSWSLHVGQFHRRSDLILGTRPLTRCWQTGRAWFKGRKMNDNINKWYIDATMRAFPWTPIDFGTFFFFFYQGWQFATAGFCHGQLAVVLLFISVQQAFPALYSVCCSQHQVSLLTVARARTFSSQSVVIDPKLVSYLLLAARNLKPCSSRYLYHRPRSSAC